MQWVKYSVCGYVTLLLMLFDAKIVNTMTSLCEWSLESKQTTERNRVLNSRYASGPTGVNGREIIGPFRYGQRNLPAGVVELQLKNDQNIISAERKGQHPAMYETPQTYEYMNNPMKNQKSRVPLTEQRPPGDDVELIYSSNDKVRSNEDSEKFFNQTTIEPQKNNNGSIDKDGESETEDLSNEMAETSRMGYINVESMARGLEDVDSRKKYPFKHNSNKKNENIIKQAVDKDGKNTSQDLLKTEATDQNQVNLQDQHDEPIVKQVLQYDVKKEIKNRQPTYKTPISTRGRHYGLQQWNGQPALTN
ncbi:uncharacterized protein LOC126908946 [Daktulosphaira vitifoliae]|uniref:uncharacterized protein LOC126908946 n=1 Tax=Daktulosphaira vitifoliae TaxID=58002 RepID=UPI0021AA572B|nr:uncharacterized protein LOC126908946 [Daktulosphaira vitifoliae]